MKIIILGSRGDGLGCHFPERFSEILKEMYENVVFHDPLELHPSREHIYNGLPFKLSKVVEIVGFEPDLIFISENGLYWDNDVSYPVFYLHNVAYRPFTVFYPDVVFFWTNKVREYFERLLAKYPMSMTKTKLIMPPAFDPNVYKYQKKIYKGINGIGYRSNEEKWQNYVDLPQAPCLICMLRDNETFKELGFNFFDSPISDFEYREKLAQCEMLWNAMPPFQWITRRIFEAMACNTLIIFNVESEEHEQYLESLGLFNNVHYVGINDVQDLKDLIITKKQIKAMTEKAYDVVMNKHTYEARVKEVIELYHKLYQK